MDLTLIVPCLDEAPNLPRLVERFAAVGASLAPRSLELLLVDDGSTDDTWEVVQRLGARHSFVRGARHAHNKGIAEAWRTGLAEARGHLVGVLDADMQYRPEDVPRLLSVLEASNADVVQGARLRRTVGSRWLFSRGLNSILNAAFEMDLVDNQSGFFICRREVLADLLSYRRRFDHWQNLVMVAARARGYRIAQVEVRFDDRTAGRSAFGDLPIAASMRVLADVGRAWLEYRR